VNGFSPLTCEIYPYDLGKYTFHYAEIAINELGDDWRLPTKEELHIMYLNKNEVGAFALVSYWSDYDFNKDYALAVNLKNGIRHNTSKRNLCYVRPVRSITI
jgi:hypothetical protein